MEAWTNPRIISGVTLEPLVQRVDRGRFRFELGNSSNGPRLSRTQEQSCQTQRAQDKINQVGLGLEREVNSMSCHQGGQEDLDPSPTREVGIQIRRIALLLKRMISFMLGLRITIRMICTLDIQKSYGKLTPTSFPTNHEDSQLELQGFGQVLCRSAMPENCP